MKRLWEYDVTEEEMWRMHKRGPAGYEVTIDFFKRFQHCIDEEKQQIADLLYTRGDKEGSRAVIDSIEDDETRQEAQSLYDLWGLWEKGILVVN